MAPSSYPYFATVSLSSFGWILVELINYKLYWCSQKVFSTAAGMVDFALLWFRFGWGAQNLRVNGSIHKGWNV